MDGLNEAQTQQVVSTLVQFSSVCSVRGAVLDVTSVIVSYFTVLFCDINPDHPLNLFDPSRDFLEFNL